MTFDNQPFQRGRVDSGAHLNVYRQIGLATSLPFLVPNVSIHRRTTNAVTHSVRRTLTVSLSPITRNQKSDAILPANIWYLAELIDLTLNRTRQA